MRSDWNKIGVVKVLKPNPTFMLSLWAMRRWLGDSSRRTLGLSRITYSLSSYGRLSTHWMISPLTGQCIRFRCMGSQEISAPWKKKEVGGSDGGWRPFWNCLWRFPTVVSWFGWSKIAGDILPNTMPKDWIRAYPLEIWRVENLLLPLWEAWSCKWLRVAIDMNGFGNKPFLLELCAALPSRASSLLFSPVKKVRHATRADERYWR